MFTREEFIAQYNELSRSPDMQKRLILFISYLIREAANHYILKFQQSDQCWPISQQLIFDAPSLEIQFIACQLIYRKTKQSYLDLPTTNQNELKTFLIGLLNNSNSNLAPPSQLQICSSIASIMIQDQSLWPTCLTDLIQLMQNGQMKLGLEIISQMAIETKEMIGRQKMLRVQEAFISQKTQLFELFRSLLQIQDLNILENSLKCLDAWIEFGLQIFEDTPLVSAILSLATTHEGLFILICQIISNAIKFSNHKNMHRNEALLKQSAKLIPLNEAASILEILKFIKIITNLITNANEPICRAFTELITRFSTDLMIFLFDDPIPLLDALCLVTSHPSRRVSLITFEFWTEYRQMLYQRRTELQSIEHTFSYYFKIMDTLIDKCKLHSIKMTRKFLGGENKVNEDDDDEQEQQEVLGQEIVGKLTAIDYREYAKDIFFTIYEAAKNMNQQDTFFKIIIQNMDIINQISQNPTLDNLIFQITKSEAAILVVQSILDDFLIETDTKSINFIVEYILNLESQVLKILTPPKGWMDIIAKTSLQLFYEYTQQFKQQEDLFMRVVKYLLQFMTHNLLGPLAAQALDGISLAVKNENNIEIIQLLINYFQQYWTKFQNQAQMENYISGVFMLGLYLNDQVAQFSIFSNVLNGFLFNFSSQLSSKPSSQTSVKTSSKAPQLMSRWTKQLTQYYRHSTGLSFTKKISRKRLFSYSHNSQAIKDLPVQMTEILLNPLIQLFQNQIADNFDLKNKVVKLLKILLKVSNYETQSQGIESILNLTINIVINDPIKNAAWLDILSLAVLRQENNQFILNWVLNNLSKINQICINQQQIWQDPDLLRYHVGFLRQILLQDITIILNSPEYQAILQVLSVFFTQINQYEMQREILFFFKEFVMKSKINIPNYQQAVYLIINIIFSNLLQINHPLMTQISQIMIYLSRQITNKLQFAQLIFEGLKVCPGQSKPDNKLTLISKAIVQLSCQTQLGQHNRELGMLLQNTASYSDEEINYMQLELLLRKTEWK